MALEITLTRVSLKGYFLSPKWTFFPVSRHTFMKLFEFPRFHGGVLLHPYAQKGYCGFVWMRRRNNRSSLRENAITRDHLPRLTTFAKVFFRRTANPSWTKVEGNRE